MQSAWMENDRSDANKFSPEIPIKVEVRRYCLAAVTRDNLCAIPLGASRRGGICRGSDAIGYPDHRGIATTGGRISTIGGYLAGTMDAGKTSARMARS